MSLTCSEASNVLAKKGHLMTLGDAISPANFCSRMKHRISPTYHTDQVFRIAKFVKEKIDERPENLQEWVQLGDAFVLRYKKDPTVKSTVKIFDLALAPFREQMVYHFPENQKLLDKWRHAGQSDEIIKDAPYFAEFLDKSKVLSQIKATSDRLEEGHPALTFSDGDSPEPMIQVEGEWVKKRIFINASTSSTLNRSTRPSL